MKLKTKKILFKYKVAIILTIFLFIGGVAYGLYAAEQMEYLNSRVLTTDSSYSKTSYVDMVIDLNGGTASWFEGSSYKDCWNGPYVFLYDNANTSLSSYSNLTTLWGYNTDSLARSNGGGRGVHFRTKGTVYYFKQPIDGVWYNYYSVANPQSKIISTSVSGSKITIQYRFDVQASTPYMILPQVTKHGYNFTSWTVKTDAKWYAYDYNEDTGESRAKYSGNVGSKSTVSMKDSSGKTWYLLHMGQTSRYDTITANYTPWQHTVSYNANGGSGAPGNQTKTFGSQMFLTTTKPTREGYTFVGWNTAADGSGTVYYAGDEYTADRNGGTVTLYAQWDDGSAPTASIKVTPNTWAYEPEITVEGTDSGSGVSKIEIYRVNDNEDVLVQTDTFSSSSRGSSKTSHKYEGTYEYYGIVYDAEGNSTRTHNVTVYVDRTKPVISLENIPNEWENKGSFVISADISDALSGIKEQKILLNGEEISNEYTVTADGEYTLVITAMDYAGNTQEYNCTFALDRVGPVISSNVPEGWTNKECFVLHVDVTDALAGVKDYAIYYNEVEQPNNVSITADGQHPYTVWAVDYAGNVTVVSYVLKLDHTPPTFTDKYSHLPEANIKYEASDVTSGLASFKVYDKYGVERDDDSKIPGYINYNGFSTGLDAFYLEAIDNAGNVARLDLKTEETFKVVAEIVDGGYEYKGDILGYLPDTEVTLDIHTYGYVEYVEVVFEKKLSDAAISQGYEIDRTAEKGNHFVYQIPVKKDDSFQYTFKIPQLPKITDAKERKEEIYDIKVTAYRAGIGRSKKLELPVCNMLYIKKRKLGYYKTIIIYN